MTAIVDYGVGNLFSLKSSLMSIGAEAVATADAEIIEKADRIILPGVGAFGDAIDKLRAAGTDRLIIKEAEKGKPVLGICLGMQLLFDKSYEYGEHPGLGLIGGNIVPMKGVIPEDFKIPHIGWNALIMRRSSRIFKYIKDGEHMYFVHSYYAADCGESVIADTEYGAFLTAAAEREIFSDANFIRKKAGMPE